MHHEHELQRIDKTILSIMSQRSHTIDELSTIVHRRCGRLGCTKNTVRSRIELIMLTNPRVKFSL